VITFTSGSHPEHSPAISPLVPFSRGCSVVRRFSQLLWTGPLKNTRDWPALIAIGGPRAHEDYLRSPLRFRAAMRSMRCSTATKETALDADLR